MSDSAVVTRGARVEHAYGKSMPWSVGVEEEFQLLSPSTFNLVSQVDLLMARASDEDLLQIKHELLQSVVETATCVCSNIGEAEYDLKRLRQKVSELAGADGAVVASAGTHPFAHYNDQQVTDKPRYRAMIERLRWIAERELIYGLHVHVGIETPDKAMYVFNGIRLVLPELLALSANSPFWLGRHTGLQSSRTKIFDSFPRSGVPQAFASWNEYEALVQRFMRAGAIEDYTYLWWDVRPHPAFGTIEVRVCDAQTRLTDTVALAALIQATCAWLGSRYDNKETLTVVPQMLIEENKWSASRYGLDGEFIDFESDERIHTREAVNRLIEKVEPFAQQLGSADQFAGLDSLLVFNGAARQLNQFAESGTLESVSEMIAADTIRGLDN